MGRRLLFSRRSPVVAVVVLLAITVTACGVPGIPLQTNVTPPGQTTTVQRGTIQTIIGASGTVQPAQEVTLNFTSGEIIKTVTVSVGQRVKAGDVLGTVDTADLTLALQQQQANVASAQAKYDATAAGALPKDIAVAQANVDAARAKYQATATISPKDIQVARANLDQAIASYNGVVAGTTTPQDIASATANLDAAIAKYNGVLQGTTTPQDIANAEAAVRSAQAKLDALNAGPLKADVISAQSKVQEAQQNLDKTKSDGANTKEQANIKWQQSADATKSAQRQFDIANATYQQAKATNTDPNASGGSGAPVGKGTPVPPAPTITPLKLSTLKQAADSAYLTEQQAEKTQEANRLAYENAKNAEVNNNATAQQQLNDAQAALSKLLAGPTSEDVTQAQAAVDQAKAQLDKLKRGPTDTDVATAQAAVDQARAQLDKLKNGPTPADVAKAQASIDSARATLNDLLAGPKPTDLQQAQASVDSAVATLNDLQGGAKPTDLETALAALDQAKAQRDLAQLKVDQTTVTAPFAGILTQVNAIPGQISGGSTGGTNATPNFDLVDDSELHIDVSVSEGDAASVQVGQAALITLDSVPGQTLQGAVQRINPVATTTQNVTAFPVRIVLTPTTATVRPGANATVQIVTARQSNVLVVPSRAVQTINGQRAVTVLFNGSTFLVPVQVGLSDGRNTEITGGLNEGDTVVLPVAGSTGGAPGGGPGGGPGGAVRIGG
ncbi:MAG: efflux RND transporter periplasmic adaptor subunit [Thermomicrobia bacterium]|nr:efflux RND transporter periplasmic adaptor subunit [Thermomicrobia bacterium]